MSMKPTQYCFLLPQQAVSDTEQYMTDDRFTYTVTHTDCTCDSEEDCTCNTWLIGWLKNPQQALYIAQDYLDSTTDNAFYLRLFEDERSTFVYYEKRDYGVIRRSMGSCDGYHTSVKTLISTYETVKTQLPDEIPRLIHPS